MYNKLTGSRRVTRVALRQTIHVVTVVVGVASGARGEDKAAEAIAQLKLAAVVLMDNNGDGIENYADIGISELIEIDLSFALNLIKQLPNIDTLQIGGGTMKASDVAEAKAINTVRDLILCDCTIEQDAIKHLSEIPKVTFVYMVRCTLSPKEAENIAGFSHADYVWFDACKGLNDYDYAFVKKMTTLSGIRIGNDNYHVGDGEDKSKIQHFSDQQAEVLRGHPSLRGVALINTHVTDRIFAILETIPKLESVALQCTAVTKEAAMNFMKKHPQVRVSYGPLGF